MPILFFAAAGALFAGGTGGSLYLWKRGCQEAARQLQRLDAKAARQALTDAVDLADLRKEARAAGLDPDEVVAGYEKMRDEQLSPQDVLRMLGQAAVTD
ncbi:hypothetical protein ACFVFD_02515 [Streptomyces fimicarius]|uniref:hypothetical protein n=1 Tax=Streptomyces griseus TaxID=1911 RepID=UPI0036CF0520